MRIAVTYKNGDVFQHFGHTERFKIYDIEDNKVLVATTVNTNNQGISGEGFADNKDTFEYTIVFK